MKNGLLFFFLLIPSFLIGQTDSLIREDVPLDQDIEDLVGNTETESQVDFEEFTDLLTEFRTNPLDLNAASYEQLLQLPGMNAIHANQLMRHIQKFGPLTSIYELQAVSGYHPALIREFLPFVTVRTAGARDISPGAKHSRGPSLRLIREGMKYEFLQRLTGTIESQRGYTDPDTSFKEIRDDLGELIRTDTSLSTRYLGSPYRIYSRFRARYGNHVSAALVGEKDPGEVFEWNPERRQYGYDYVSGHVSIGGFGPLKRLVIGDYNIQTGQGMVLSRGLGFGKGAQVINNIKMPNYGIRPYSSVNENQLLRGAAATFATGNVYYTGFYSYRNLDATIGLRDTLTEEIIFASGLRLGGLHRTPSELAARQSISESLYGGRVEYKSPTLTIGTTHYVQQFGGPIARPLNDYSLFNFVGDQNYLNGLDFDWVWQNFNFFGEFARSKSGGTGASLGLMSSLSPTVDFSLLARRYTPDFHSDKGYVFAERPTALQNETGLYMGLRIAPNPKWAIQSYFDQYYFPWNRFRVSYPSRGWEFMTQLDYKPKRGTLVYARFRSDNRMINASNLPEGPGLKQPIPATRTQLRLHFQTKVDRVFQLKSRLEFSWFEQEGTVYKGMLLYQDISWKPSFSLKLTARYALFDVEDYDARIFAYENDIYGFFSIPPYSNTGSRYYFIVNWKAGRHLEFWGRIAQSRFHNLNIIGSGLDEIEGSTRTTFKLQMRIKF